MKVHTTGFPGLIFIEPRIFGDSRGWFYESWNKERYAEIGITDDFVQDNVSFSSYGVLRGLHYQKPYTQGKLVSVLQGKVWDVVVDLRKSSPTFGKWQGFTLTGEGKEQLYVPKGFAHGFCVLSETTLFQYKCTDKYSPESEQGVMWNDETLNIPWPVENPVISEKDTRHPMFHALTDDLLFD
ncbi:dTDP-4-dehydrorhamnose 3,5-epimerase [Cloacibacillus evryensis]|uniref:dTDP-4-dehydrorhamnose 3,5-epimerase n=1 Tax=Cloacibacillus evryensis TaxID=508460 RepID=A0AAW5K9X5_9BACT|nr:dTDP-4-dehydrorhamnose 3,5-epimerase [Cloacibacillus evryensis]MCQ4814648.1 dTDP-4-dehydrorhamnose 3,5-epimerase [Cloacibacillus evryensis]